MWESPASARPGSPKSSLLAHATPEAAALASLALAEEARSRADGPTMIEAGTRALELAQRMGLRRVEFDALDIVGLAEAWSGQLTAAVERRRRATEIALELGDLARAAWSMAGYNAIGLLGLGRLDEAERQATEAMRLAKESGSLRALESVHPVFGFLRRAQDRLDEAIAHGRERLALAEELGERLWHFNTLVVSLAGPLIELERYEEAWACLERALSIASEAGGEALESFARSFRIEILLAWGRIDDAEHEAERIGSSEPFPQVAHLREAQGRNEEGEDIWRRTLEAYEGSEDRLERAEMMIGYARFLAGCGRTDEGRTSLSEARTLVGRTGAKFHEWLIHETEALLTR